MPTGREHYRLCTRMQHMTTNGQVVFNSLSCLARCLPCGAQYRLMG